MIKIIMFIVLSAYTKKSKQSQIDNSMMQLENWNQEQVIKHKPNKTVEAQIVSLFLPCLKDRVFEVA